MPVKRSVPVSRDVADFEVTHMNIANNYVISILAAGLLSLAQSTVACDYPARPDIPDGAAATKDEMLEASASVKDYLAKVDEYLNCIEDAEKDAVDSMAERPNDEELRRRNDMLNKRFDAANEEKALVGEMFNQQVRAFNEKARAARN